VLPEDLTIFLSILKSKPQNDKTLLIPYYITLHPDSKLETWPDGSYLLLQPTDSHSDIAKHVSIHYNPHSMEQASTNSRTPNPRDYDHFGAYLRDLREHFSLDIAEVARRTHIRAKYIQAMEDGQIDLMPGKVYARGYVVTYAEFFSLNAEEFATRYMEQHFAQNQPAEQPESLYFIPEPKRVRSSQNALWKTRLQLAATILVVTAIIYAILPQDPAPAPTATTVAPVPDRLLGQMRTLVMPTPENIECLTSDRWLACLDRAEMTRLPSIVSSAVIISTEEASSSAIEENSSTESDGVPDGVTETPHTEAPPTDIEQPLSSEKITAAPEVTKKEPVKPIEKIKPAVAPLAKKPAVKSTPADKKPAEVPQKSTPALQENPFTPPASTPATAPPDATSTPAPDSAPPAAEPAPNTKPKKEEESLIPSSWFDILPDAASIEESAPAPNRSR
jgi:hypothetical protein